MGSDTEMLKRQRRMPIFVVQGHDLKEFLKSVAQVPGEFAGGILP
jgi:hypothetical protein